MSKLINLLLIIFLTSCTSKIEQSSNLINPISDKSYNQLLNKKYHHSFVSKSLEYSAKFKRSQKDDMNKLHQIIIKISAKKNIKLDRKLREKIKENLENELKFLKNFNAKTKPLTFFGLDDSMSNPTLDPAYVMPQVKYNKLNLFTQKSLTFSDGKLRKIINGKIISEIFSNNYLFPAGDNKKNIMANMTIPSTIIVMLKTLKTIDPKSYHNYIKNNLNTNSLFYFYQSPRGIKMNSDSIFKASNHENEGIILIHNGYSFGGSINFDNVRSGGFHTMPHDCASYISHLVDIGFDPITKRENIIWTGDLQNLVNLTFDEKFISLKDLKQNLPAYGAFSQKIQAIKLNDIDQVQEGDLLMIRKFSPTKQQSNSLGKGGHIGVVLGTNNKDEIYILSYVRNYEKLGTGGFLISAVSFQTLQDDIYSTYLLRLKLEKENVVKIKVNNHKCQLTYKGQIFICKAGDEVKSGEFPINQAFYRKDRIKNITTDLPLIEIKENYGWCETKFAYLPQENCQNLYLEEHFFDLMIPMGKFFLNLETKNQKLGRNNISLKKDDLIDLLN
ncbi:MAG: hypothetical protein ACJA02_000359 [Myxococcota bacterium]|jgi:hypothetical protein